SGAKQFSSPCARNREVDRLVLHLVGLGYKRLSRAPRPGETPLRSCSDAWSSSAVTPWEARLWRLRPCFGCHGLPPPQLLLFQCRKEPLPWSIYSKVRESLLQVGFSLGRHFGDAEMQHLELLEPGQMFQPRVCHLGFAEVQD